MKIAMRLLILTMVLAAGSVQSGMFSGPGAPPTEPPVAAI